MYRRQARTIKPLRIGHFRTLSKKPTILNKHYSVNKKLTPITHITLKTIIRIIIKNIIKSFCKILLRKFCY